MQALTDFLGQTWVLAVMVLALLGLIGTMVFLRKKPKDDDDDE